MMNRTLGPIGPFRERLDAFSGAARGIDKGDVEAVHKTRVASRRLREILPVLALDSDIGQKLSRRVKRVTRRLGVVRELDVLMLMIEELGRDSRYSSAALNQVSAGVQRDRVAARERLAAKLPLLKIDRLARRLKRAAEQRESGTDQGGPKGRVRLSGRAWVWAVEARAIRRAARVRVAIETAGTAYDPERLHDVRIAVKKLRYALELVAYGRSQRESRDIDGLKATQDLLGRLHDLEILIRRARHEQASLSPLTLIAWRELDSLISALEDDCRTLHAHYMSDRLELLRIAHRTCDTKKQALPVNRRAVG
jgi:CHAD domain-containing protein